MKKITVSLILALITFGGVLNSVHANATTENREVWDKSHQNIQGLMKEGKLSTIVKPTLKAERQVVKADRCELVTSRINARLNLYSNNKDNYSNRYVQYKTVVAEKVIAWKAKGCDTAAVEADITVLDQKLTEFAAAFRDFHTTLQGTRTYVCGESQGKFVGEVSAAHQKQLVMKQKAVALRDFVINTLRSHIKSIRATCEPPTTVPKVTGE